MFSNIEKIFETKIDRIIKGKTTRSEVIKLLGRPSSSMVAPMVEETRGEAVGCSYSTVSGGVFSGFDFLTSNWRFHLTRMMLSRTLNTQRQIIKGKNQCVSAI